MITIRNEPSSILANRSVIQKKLLRIVEFGSHASLRDANDEINPICILMLAAMLHDEDK